MPSRRVRHESIRAGFNDTGPIEYHLDRKTTFIEWFAIITVGSAGLMVVGLFGYGLMLL